MELNFKEGMFLGKQELERQKALEACFEDSISRLIVGTENFVNEGLEGLYAPQKLNYKLSKKTIDGVEGIAVSSFNLDGSPASLGRLIVGKKNGQKIGVVTDSGFTGKECFLPLSEFIPADPTGYNDLYFIFRLKPATTNYELSLISVSSSGVGTFSIPSLVMPLFREATGGRATTIKTSGNQVLKVASVDLVNNRVQFEGTSFTAETNVQFMFLQTLSPFTTDIPQPLYTYATCELICDATGYADLETGFIRDNVSVPLGYALYYTDDGLQDPDTPSSYLGMFLDTVGKGQITSEKIENGAVGEDHLKNFAVTTNKIYPGAVNRVKLAVNAWGFRSVIPDTGSQHETLYFEPGQIGFIYNENNPSNDRYLVPRIPSGFTAEMAILQPTKIILQPNASLNPDVYTELREYFKTTGTGISLYFPNTMEGVQPGEFIYEVFDVFWMSLTKAVVTWSRVNIEW
jgi:hypothetical protein